MTFSFGVWFQLAQLIKSFVVTKTNWCLEFDGKKQLSLSRLHKQDMYLCFLLDNKKFDNVI